MDAVLIGVLVSFPVILLALLATYVYFDAPKHDMHPQKWAVISFFIPFFGFFAYLFERDERTGDTTDRDEMFVDGPFEIHKSRADDAPFTSSASKHQGENEGKSSDDSSERR